MQNTGLTAERFGTVGVASYFNVINLLQTPLLYSPDMCGNEFPEDCSWMSHFSEDSSHVSFKIQASFSAYGGIPHRDCRRYAIKGQLPTPCKPHSGGHSIIISGADDILMHKISLQTTTIFWRKTKIAKMLRWYVMLCQYQLISKMRKILIVDVELGIK